MSKNKKNIFYSFIDKINFFKKKKNNNIDFTIKDKIDNKLKKKKIYLSKNIIVKKNKKKTKKNNYFIYLKNKFLKTKKKFESVFRSFFIVKKIDKNFLMNLEEKLISCDISFKTSQKIIKNSINNINHNQLKNPKIIYQSIINEMKNILKKSSKKEIIFKNLTIILLVGINGSGKTTTIVKISKLYQKKNKTVLVSAADTFRAAAVSQIKNLCEKNKINIFFKDSKSDPASVVYDSIKQAISKNFDVLIIDTAGRLHTNINLMNELKKIVRVIKKNNKTGTLEIFLTIDSCNGQNSLVQADLFNKFLGVTGIILTKFDGTSKGGIIFSISDQFEIPIQYITTGESINDIVSFNSKQFVKTIFKNEL
ncbi:MAG: signal recognition particle-docking protein FtsY [Buchnera aphidicola (Periphyllus acericola)]|uniref:signal recognition particle-docking protein FtsY n=1 Tax=Buchnera aphidicola TaxID=9 RepID=UPI0030CD425A|nr:signal recognition particle-docking protein FtsY [Buchnera aphidicola (Periphyllus acericola)]